ncbi:hypothetical protein HDU91_000769, partial [Kappamyces sp. JEL0680]
TAHGGGHDVGPLYHDGPTSGARRTESGDPQKHHSPRVRVVQVAERSHPRGRHKGPALLSLQRALLPAGHFPKPQARACAVGRIPGLRPLGQHCCSRLFRVRGRLGQRQLQHVQPVSRRGQAPQLGSPSGYGNDL